MASGLFSLCTSVRFAPLLITQFLGAFNDNLFKNVFLVALIFGTGVKVEAIAPGIFITLAAGLFILPYVLFSAIAGELADKYEKSRLVLYIKIAELLLMGAAALGFHLSNPWLLLVVLFLMGAQSAFFSPLKYSLVPDHLEAREIVAGNAVLEASTFLAILTGTIAGGMLAGVEDGVKTACEWLVVLSLAGVVSSMRIPASGPFAPQLKLNLNPLSSTVAIVRDALANPVLRRTIIGISWFWLLGAAFLSQFPAYGKDVLGGSEQVVTLLLSAFSIGIAAGSFLAHRLLKETLSTRYVMASMLAMSVFIADIYLAQPVMADEGLHDISGFLAHAANWRILFDLVMIAISGGVYIVPLNAILQTQAQPESRARMIAANNIMNALFMFSASALLAVGLWAGFSIPQLFLALGGMNLLVGFYMRRLTLSAA